MRWFFFGTGNEIFEWLLRALWRHPAVVVVVLLGAGVGAGIGTVVGRLLPDWKNPWE